jgi:hypothetical protein
MLNQMKDLITLVDAATIDGKNYQNYDERFTPVVEVIKAYAKIDISTPEGRKAIMAILATDEGQRQLRYNTYLIGKRTYAAMIRYLIDTL